jgi:quinol monooxygenase YgiN
VLKVLCPCTPSGRVKGVDDRCVRHFYHHSRWWWTTAVDGNGDAHGPVRDRAYTPKPGRDAQLTAAVRKHLRALRDEELVTERPAYVMRAGDGSIVEVFEWRSAEAIRAAHGNPAVQALWAEFGEACDFTPLAGLAETHQLFAEFEGVEL